MRYTKEHKAQSRSKIIESARQLFRSRGFDDVSIDEVMNHAGLTRGTFYAHFQSKKDLASETLGTEAGLVRRLQSAANTPHPDTTAVQVLTEYLHPTERSNIAGGCPLIAHPVDAIRAGASVQEGYTERLSALVASIEGVLDGEAVRERAVLVSVLAVGAGLLSSASGDAALADQIESASLSKIEELVTDSS